VASRSPRRGVCRHSSAEPPTRELYFLDVSSCPFECFWRSGFGHLNPKLWKRLSKRSISGGEHVNGLTPNSRAPELSRNPSFHSTASSLLIDDLPRISSPMDILLYLQLAKILSACYIIPDHAVVCYLFLRGIVAVPRLMTKMIHHSLDLRSPP
jgi:hypothetical protein